MAYSALTGYLQVQFNWAVNGPAVSTSISFPPTTSSNTLAQKITFGLGGDTANSANVVASNVLTMAESSSATLNLNAITDVLATASIAQVRLKVYYFNLLSVAQDSTNGTNATSVLIEGGASNPNTLNLGGTTPTAALLNGDVIGYATGSAAGLTVSNTVANTKVANQDSGNAAACFYGLMGATS